MTCNGGEHVLDYAPGTTLDDAILRCSLCGQEPGPKFWESHCWSKRFVRIVTTREAPCGKRAHWKGNGSDTDTLGRAWRSCDEHRQAGDVPYPEAP